MTESRLDKALRLLGANRGVLTVNGVQPKAPEKSWYAMEAQGNHSAEILIYDEIGMWGITAKRFAEDLRDLGNIKSLNIRINSPGGSVTDSNAIYNTIRNHAAHVTVSIDGIALSMGSVIAMSGDHIEMADNALMMIHNPWSGAVGDAGEMRKTADVMDKMKKTMVSAYIKQTGLSEEVVSDMMDDETWLDATEALEQGFIDEISGEIELAASFDLSEFRNVPERLKPSDIADKLEESTMPKKIDGKDTTVEDAKAIAAKATKDALATEAQRCLDIRGVFAPHKAEHSDLLDTCLADQAVDVEGARKALLDAMGKGHTPSGASSVSVREDASDKFRASAQEAMEIRSGTAENNGANEMRGYTLLEIARKSLEINGVNTGNMSKLQIVGAAFTHSTSDFPSLLENSLGKQLQTAYQTMEETWREIAAVSSVPDFKVNSRIRMGSFNSLAEVKEGGEFTYGSIGDEKETIQAVTKGKMISFTRQAIINDDLGGFMRMAAYIGRAAARTVGNDVYSVINTNAAMADAVAIFHATHSNLAGTGAAMTMATLGAGRSAMRLQKDLDDNDFLGIKPAVLLVPDALADLANSHMSSETDFSQANSKKPNTARNMAKVVSDPRLDATSVTAWYLIADPSYVPVVEVAFLDGNQTPYLESKDGWTVDGVEMKVRLDYGVDSIDHRGGYKNAGA
jgi:ATP-dependent Clp endopeptidase proteolytic subunit ClpP